MAALFIKLIISIVFVAAFIILNFSIFKLKIKGNDKQIATIAVIVGGVNFYFKFVIDSEYFIIIQTLTYIISLTTLRRYPLLYSLLVGTIGSVAGTILDASVSFAAVWLKISNFDLMVSSLLHFSIFHIVQSFIYITIAYILYKCKIGFSFNTYKFYIIEKYNVIWMLLLVLITVGLTFGSQHYTVVSLHAYILSFITIALITLLIYGYYQNKKTIQERKDAMNIV